LITHLKVVNMEYSLNHGNVYVDGELKKINILVRNGKIEKLSETALEQGEIIDCTKKWVIPGAIDPHVHFRTPGGEYKEDWSTGSQAAAAGGVTTVVDMPNTNPPTTSVSRLEEKRQIVRKQSLVNFGFHFGASPGNIEEVKAVKGIVGIKVYFGSTTGNLLVNQPDYLRELFEISKVPLLFHAENDRLIGENRKKVEELGIKDYRVHGMIRNVEVARSAVEEILGLAAGFDKRVYFCHVSTQAEMELILSAKDRLDVYCEVTPHHLFLTEEILKDIGFFGKVNPPLREEKDRDYVYKALLNGDIDCMGTDHAPHAKDEKQQVYDKAPSGMPGLETMLPLLLTEVHRGNMSLSRLIELSSETPAKVFSMKNKAYIKPGYDGDLVVVDPAKSYVISQKNLFSKSGWNPFEGREVTGSIDLTMVLGQPAYRDGRCLSVRGEEVICES
ncbi:MAG: dihydroorotase family protein, partial [Spirochaetota bacterium]|nr:dihydroorotase family protein [Spirochaetota bacterium]